MPVSGLPLIRSGAQPLPFSEGRDDALHRTGGQGGITGNAGVEGLTGQNTAEKAGRRPGIARIERAVRFCQSMKADTVYGE